MYTIFLDLHKAYDALDRDIYMEILKGCRVGPQACRVFCAFWGRLHIVACAGGYYGAAFQEFRGVTQGDPIPLTIFNVVVDTVVHQLILLVPGSAGGQDSWGR